MAFYILPVSGKSSDFTEEKDPQNPHNILKTDKYGHNTGWRWDMNVNLQAGKTFIKVHCLGRLDHYESVDSDLIT